MSTEYYIVESNGSPQGPFDLVSLVKKIRSGKVRSDSEIFLPGMQHPVLAKELPELVEFFDESASEDGGSPFSASSHSAYQANPSSAVSISPAHYLKEALAFMGSNQSIAVIGGGFILATLMLIALLYSILPSVLTAILGTVIGGLCYFMFLTCALQMVRHHPTDLKFLKDLMSYHFKQFLPAAAFAAGIAFGLPALLGATINSVAFLLMILGIIVFAFFVFTPFILMDDASLSYKEGLMTSKNWVKSQGMDTVGALVGILFVNVIGGLLFFFPLFITLPLTSIALAEIYEQHILRG